MKTLQRRAKEWSITTYSTVTNSELDEIVRQYVHSFLSAGEAMTRGHLCSVNVRVQRERIRQFVRRVTGSDSSPLPAIYRRTYSVPGPNELWHVDGNHKLIRWRLVIHGGIDGYSRLVTYLQCSNNNRSDAVFDCFLRATEEYGMPMKTAFWKCLMYCRASVFLELSSCWSQNTHTQRLHELY